MSKYNNKEYLHYLDLKQKYSNTGPSSILNRRATSSSLRQSLKLDELLKRSKELDREMEGLDPVEGTKKTDIEELVKLWNDNKRILGIQDS